MQNSLKKLVTGLLLRSTEKQTQEPENYAIDRVSKELRFLERQLEYAWEIERVLKELHITVNLVTDLKSRTEKEVCGTSREDLLIYYEGSFFNLVHQMKDKILQLVNTMTEDTVPEKPTEQDDVKLKDLLEKKEKKILDLGIRTELELWDQQNPKSCVAVVLRKRTTHHHRVSQSPYNQNVLNLKFVGTMLKPHTKPLLTPFATEYLEKMRVESIERLFTDTLSKMTKTLEAMEDNLNKIAQSLITNAKLPVSDEEGGKIGLDFIKMLQSFNVKNNSAFEKIPQIHREKINRMINKFSRVSETNKIEAVYLVGSLGRGEYQEGYSDINIYVIVASKSPGLQKSITKIIPYDRELSLLIFSKEQFLSKESKKYRFIVYSDGILLCGSDLLKGEEFPKPGLDLALLLNEDFIEKLEAIEKWIINNPRAIPSEISGKSKALAKDRINCIYGVVISNKPQYTSSRQGRVQAIAAMYPENINMLDTLLKIIMYGVGTLGSLENMVSGIKPEAIENLQRMKNLQVARSKHP